MAEQKRSIKYSNLEYRPSQASIQVSGGGASVPNIPPQYGSVSKKLGDASRSEQFAKALGQLGPAFKSLAFAFGEGYEETRKQEAIDQEKLHEQYKLLGESLADSGHIFKKNVDDKGNLIEGEPIWKVFDSNGNVRELKNDDVTNPLQLTLHNINTVQKYYNHRKAFHAGEIFNTYAVENADNFLSATKLDYDYKKRNLTLPHAEGSITDEKPDGRPIDYKTYYALELGKLRSTQYQRFGREYHSSIDIEKGIGEYRKAFSKHFSNEIKDGILRDSATSIALFITGLPPNGAVKDQWPKWRDQITGPGSPLDTEQKDLMLINALKGRLQDATYNTIDQINPRFLLNSNTIGPRLVDVKNLNEPIIQYAKAWEIKKTELEKAKENEIKDNNKKTRDLERKTLGGVEVSLRSHIANNGIDIKSNRNLATSVLSIIVALAEPGKEGEIADGIYDQINTSYDFAEKIKDKEEAKQAKKDKEFDEKKAQGITGQVGWKISNTLTNIKEVDSYEEYESVVNKIAAFSKDIFNDLNANGINKAQAKLLLDQVGIERTRLYGLWKKSSEVQSVADAEIEQDHLKSEATKILSTMFTNGDDLDGNRDLLFKNKDLIISAGFNYITIDNKLDALKQRADEKKSPSATVTDKEVYLDLLDLIDARKEGDEAERFLIQEEISRAIGLDELTLSDASRLRGYNKKDPKETSWTQSDVYKNVLERTIGRYNPARLSPFSPRGRAELYTAYNESRYIIKDEMRKWTEGLGRPPTNDEIKEKVLELADGIHTDPYFIGLEETSKVQTEDITENLKKVLGRITGKVFIEQDSKDEEVEPITLIDYEAAFNDLKNNNNAENFHKIYKPLLLILNDNDRYNTYKGGKGYKKEVINNLNMDYIASKGMFKGIKDKDQKGIILQAILWFIDNTP